LTGYEKAAIFLISMGEEAAAEVVKALNARDIERITTHMTRVKTVNNAAIDNVLKEASEMISKGVVHLRGHEFVKNVLSKGLGEYGATKIMELASKEGLLDSLRQVDSKTLANLLLTEHPQTAAFITCLLDPVKAVAVLSLLPDGLKLDIAMRIATIERIPENAIEELNEVLKGQLDIEGRAKKFSGIKTIAEILNYCERSTEQMILKTIEEQSAELADSIRHFMFVFDDLIKVDDRGIQMILNEITTEELGLALKTVSEALKKKIFKNMSQRAAQILKDEMQAKGPVRVSEVEKAQQNILKVARKLEAEDKIIFAIRGGEVVV
jgi:flagellar motor switch protein FliG